MVRRTSRWQPIVMATVMITVGLGAGAGCGRSGPLPKGEIYSNPEGTITLKIHSDSEADYRNGNIGPLVAEYSLEEDNRVRLAFDHRGTRELAYLAIHEEWLETEDGERLYAPPYIAEARRAFSCGVLKKKGDEAHAAQARSLRFAGQYQTEGNLWLGRRYEEGSMRLVGVPSRFYVLLAEHPGCPQVLLRSSLEAFDLGLVDSEEGERRFGEAQSQADAELQAERERQAAAVAAEQRRVEKAAARKAATRTVDLKQSRHWIDVHLTPGQVVRITTYGAKMFYWGQMSGSCALRFREDQEPFRFDSCPNGPEVVYDPNFEEAVRGFQWLEVEALEGSEVRFAACGTFRGITEEQTSACQALGEER